MVKRFLFETKNGEEVLRFMLTDALIPMSVPNKFIEMKSLNKLGTGKVYAYKLCVFFNYLDDELDISYDMATNSHIISFIDYLIYGDLKDCKILDLNQNLSYSTLTTYVSCITEFYRFIHQNYGSKMTFYEGERKCSNQSYFYGQIYNYDYSYLINKTLPNLKGKKKYIKWYTQDEIARICENFNCFRDKAVFLITLEGFRIDEAFSIKLSSYDSTERLIQPTRSKMKESAVDGYENKLRKVRISIETAQVLKEYISTERTVAENKSRIISDVLFINIRGKDIGLPLKYANYREILIKCAKRAGLDSDKIRTHSGRSTKVMQVLEYNALYPDLAKTELQVKYSNEQVKAKIQAYLDTLKSKSYTQDNLSLCESFIFLGGLGFRNIGLTVEFDFLECFKHYSNIFTIEWVKTDKRLKSKHIGIDYVFETMLKNDKISIKYNFRYILDGVDSSKVFHEILEESFCEYWSKIMLKLMLNQESLSRISSRIGEVRVTRYLVKEKAKTSHYLKLLASNYTLNREVITKRSMLKYIFGTDGYSRFLGGEEEFFSLIESIIDDEYALQKTLFVRDNIKEFDFNKDIWKLYEISGINLKYMTIDFNKVESLTLRYELKCFLKHRYIRGFNSKDRVPLYLLDIANKLLELESSSLSSQKF